MRGHRMALVALAAADLGALGALRPHVAVLRHLAAPHRWLGTVGPDAAAVELASAALWVAAGWLAIGLAAAAASALPGTLGRTARRLALVVLPRAVYRLAAGAAGMGVLLSPALAGAAQAGSPAATVAPAHAVVPAPAWPTDDVLPTPAWPTSAHASTPAPPRGGNAPPARATPSDAPPPKAPDLAAPTTRSTGVVVVQPGDSLWRIAAARLPGRPSERRIAAEWPRWYAANRNVVGDDPDLIVPGQVLHAPVEEDPS